MKLLNSSSGAIAVNQATATILNDDVPKLTIKDVTRTEGNYGRTAFNFVVNLDMSSVQPITVDYATSNGSAIVGDYIGTRNTLTFAPGETSKTIKVDVIGDLIKESNETFFVNLSNPVNVELINSRSTGTIIDDDIRI